MLIQSITPSSNTYHLTFNGLIRKTNNHAQQTELKGDSVELSTKKTQSKTPMEVTIMDNEAKNLADKTDKLAQNVQSQTSEICEKAQKLFDDVQATFTDIKNNDYQGSAKIKDGTLEEYDESGKLIRRIYYTDKNKFQLNIEEVHGKTSDIYSFLNGEIGVFIKDEKRISEDEREAAEEFYIKDGQLFEYQQGIKKYYDDSVSRKNILVLENGAPRAFIKNDAYKPNKFSSQKAILFFKDKQIFEYIKGVRLDSKFDETRAKTLIFEDGQPSEYIKGYQKMDCKDCASVKKSLELIDDNWKNTTEN